MTDFLSYLRDQYAEFGSFNSEFRLRSEDYWPITLDYWFGSDRWRQSDHLFDLIGVDRSGGMYCQWIYPELRVPEPPIVFLGSEGEGVGVVASCIADLVEILAQGYAWDAFECKYVRNDHNLDPVPFAQFSSRVKSELGRELLDPEELIASARLQHPDFEAWVAARTQ